MYDIFLLGQSKTFHMPRLTLVLASEESGHPSARDECGPIHYEIDPALSEFVKFHEEPGREFPLMTVTSTDPELAGQYESEHYSKIYMINLIAVIEKFPSI